MAEEGQVIGCHPVESWKEHIQKGIDLKKLTFTEEWEVEAFLQEGKPVDKTVGAQKDELHAKIVKLDAILTASA